MTQDGTLSKYIIHIILCVKVANVRNHRHSAFYDPSLLYLLSLKGK